MNIGHIAGPGAPQENYRNRIKRIRDERVAPPSDDKVAISREAQSKQILQSPFHRTELIQSLQKKFGIQDLVQDMKDNPDKQEEILNTIADRITSTYSSSSDVNGKIADNFLNDLTT